jgi:phosphoglycerate dehydrogenase-like enzyme
MVLGHDLKARWKTISQQADLDRFLPDSDFVVICCQWTPETTRLFDKDRFAAMKAGSVLINVARGEIIDEEALADALRRDHLRGAALNVYVGEFEHAPMARLWSESEGADHAAYLGRE